MRNYMLSLLLLFTFAISAQQPTFLPITQRVNVQAEIAPASSIINNEWVAVGTNKPHAIGYDYNLLFDGKPSYRFTLKEEDNTLEGYSVGETKGRAELSYCYATAADVEAFTPDQMRQEKLAKTVYHHGKGISPQGSLRYYRFSVWIPSTLSENINTIFAQWHGMPDRTLLQNPQGEVMKISKAEFEKLTQTMRFKKDAGIDLQTKKRNGWLVEQGGYPPLAFGFANGYFYIKANSDRKWLSDKTDRCNAAVDKTAVMIPRTSQYKSSTIAYRMPFVDFPKAQWVTFYVAIQWSSYGGKSETITRDGMLAVTMQYGEGEKQQSIQIVDNQKIQIGRNDDDGYYFKFGIYRVGDSTVPVSYNLANYKEQTQPWHNK